MTFISQGSTRTQYCFAACPPGARCVCREQQFNHKKPKNKKMSDVKIYVHKNHPDAVIPEVAYNNTSAAFDIVCVEDTIIPANGFAVVPNGLNLTIDQHDRYFMYIQLRSSLGFKKPLTLHSGVVDPSYTGDLGIKLYNLGKEDIKIEKGDRYAQILVLPIPNYEIQEIKDEDWEQFKSTQLRGDKGFGSSGK